MNLIFFQLKEAVKRGLDVIEDAYDVLDVAVADSDSEDEDLPPTDEVILDPKVMKWCGYVLW